MEIQQLANGDQNVAKLQMVGSWGTENKKEPILTQPVEEIAHQRIEKFLNRAFRSPPDEKTLGLYTKYFDKIYKDTGDFTASMKSVVSGAMASPRFIMVHDEASEVSPDFDSYNLASRLSFFLWCSIPDQELLELAEQGTFRIRMSLPNKLIECSTIGVKTFVIVSLLNGLRLIISYLPRLILNCIVITILGVMTKYHTREACI